MKMRSAARPLTVSICRSSISVHVLNVSQEEWTNAMIEGFFLKHGKPPAYNFNVQYATLDINLRNIGEQTQL